MTRILDASQKSAFEGGASFPLSNRLGRLAWMIVWFFLCSWGPPGGVFSRWRALWLRLFGAKIGKSVRISGSVKVWWPPNLEVADNSLIGDGAILYCMAPTRIGRNAVVSQRAHICAGSHDIRSEHFQLVARPITVGDWAWVAAEAFVGPGVTVGEGAVLAARGAAFRDLDPWMIYRGNPAEPLKARPRLGPSATQA